MKTNSNGKTVSSPKPVNNRPVAMPIVAPTATKGGNKASAPTSMSSSTLSRFPHKGGK